MDKDRSTPLNRGKPDLVVRVFEIGRELEMIVEGVNTALEYTEAVPLRAPECGKSLYDTCINDNDVLDDWVEFILSSRHFPYLRRTAAVTGDGTAHLLQYLSFLGDWYIVSLSPQVNTDIYTVSFTKAGNFRNRAVIRELLSLKQYRDIYGVPSARGGHWVIDYTVEKILLSRGLARLLLDTDTPVVLPLRDFLITLHPDDITAISVYFSNKSGGKKSFTTRHFAASNIICLRSGANAIYGIDGSLSRLYGSSYDVSDSFDTLWELKKAAAKKAIGDICWISGADGRYSYISPNIHTLTGLPPSAFIGTSSDILPVRTENDTELRRRIRHIVETRSFGNIECRVAPVNGGFRRYAMSVFTVLGDNNELLETVGIGHDISTL